MATASASDTAIERAARWSLRLLGGFELNALPGGQRVTLPGKRERVLLAYLALSPNGRQQRRKLATLLWGDASDETALDNLRTCVWALRKALGDTAHSAIASEGDDIALDTAAFDIDALTFRLLAAQSGRTELETAANLYSGELLDGLDIENDEFESWRRAEATRYRDQAIDVLTRLTTQLCECGETEAAIEAGTRILRIEPLHEPAVRRLMRLYGESGRRGPAIQLYRTLADALKTELNAQPDAETRAVFAEVTRGSDELTQAPAVADTNPPPHTPAMAGGIAAPGDSPLPAPQLTSAVSAPRQIAPQRAKTRKLNWIFAGGLAAAIAMFLFYEFTPTRTVQDGQAGLAAARAVSATQGSAIAIAVLPFVNLSGDTAQEFFSDGMTEEITAALAKIADLRVVGRTSAFQFKGDKKDLRSIGQALNATHLLEGSVRKAGDRVRITAQLIKTDDATHIWTENYDRELTDIFAIQEDIATAIAAALRVPLGLKEGERLVSNRTIDPESYQQYLHGKALVRGLGFNPLTEAAALLEQVVARNPDYAPAWAQLAQAYDHAAAFQPAAAFGPFPEMRRFVDSVMPKADAAAQRAIQLDPNLADGYLALGLIGMSRSKSLAAEELYSKALALDPNNPEVLAGYAYLLAGVGRLKDSVATWQRLQNMEPFVPSYNQNAAMTRWVNGQTDDAIAVIKPLRNPGAARYLAQIYAAMGHYGEAADLMHGNPRNAPEMSAETERLLRLAPAKVASPQSLPRLESLSFAYLYVGASSRVLDYYESALEAGYQNHFATSILWHPTYAAVRKTERFKAYARKTGFVDYWRVKGWPQWCHPTKGDDFACN